MEYQRICVECGRPFVTDNFKRITCSGKCGVKRLQEYQKRYQKEYRKKNRSNV